MIALLRLYRAVGVMTVLLLMAGTVMAAELPTPDEVAQWVVEGKLEKLAGGTTFVQVTDVHIWGSQPEAQPIVLQEALKDVARHYPKAIFVVATGDNGVEKTFMDVVRQSPVKVFAVPGNHDGGLTMRERFAEHFPFSAPQKDPRFYFLDTRQPEAWIGCLSPRQLGKLHEGLSADAGKAVFLFGHHDAIQGLINAQSVRELLGFHRPRYRFMMMCVGHWHRARLYDPVGGVQYNMCPSLRDSGSYRVFHVLPGGVVFYDRLSPQWVALRKKLNKPLETHGKPVRADILRGDPVVMPFTDAASAKPLPKTDPGYLKYAKAFASRSNEADAVGTVLDVRFDEAEGMWARDASGWQNDIAIEALSEIDHARRQLKQKKIPPPRTKRDDGYAVAFGSAGGFPAVAYDSRTLNSPAATNRLTVAADVRLPAGPLGWPYGLVTKGTWLLTVDEKGVPAFTLQMTKGKPISATSPVPLPADSWHRVTGTFDGTRIRLYVDGVEVASQACPAGSKLRLSNRALRVGTHARVPYGKRGDTYEYLPPPTRFLLDNLRVSNKVEGP